MCACVHGASTHASQSLLVSVLARHACPKPLPMQNEPLVFKPGTAASASAVPTTPISLPLPRQQAPFTHGFGSSPVLVGAGPSNFDYFGSDAVTDEAGACPAVCALQMHLQPYCACSRRRHARARLTWQHRKLGNARGTRSRTALTAARAVQAARPASSACRTSATRAS
jgi:hypothetical protein